MIGRAAAALWAGAVGLFVLGALAGCAAAPGGAAGPEGAPGGRGANDLPPGLYRGGFGDALTEDRSDDLNYNPCDSERERCLGGDEPLVDVLLELFRDPDGRMRLAFFRSAADRDAGLPLDLLGHGCDTRIGALREVARDAESGNRVAVFPLTAGNRLCLNKLRPTADRELRVAFGTDSASGIPVADVTIDRDVVSENYLYVVEGGVRRKVRIDLDNVVESGPERSYRVCIEDALGEYTRCVVTDRDLKKVLLPVPVPGGAAVSYTWWYELTPDLRRTRGLYRLEQYSGHFVRIAATARP